MRPQELIESEDRWTRGFVRALNQCRSARVAFAEVSAVAGVCVDPDWTFVDHPNQWGSVGLRPDVVAPEDPSLWIEVKFGAALQPPQPVGYLQGIPGAHAIFIVWSRQLATVAEALWRRLDAAGLLPLGELAH